MWYLSTGCHCRRTDVELMFLVVKFLGDLLGAERR